MPRLTLLRRQFRHPLYRSPLRRPRPRKILHRPVRPRQWNRDALQSSFRAVRPPVQEVRPRHPRGPFQVGAVSARLRAHPAVPLQATLSDRGFLPGMVPRRFPAEPPVSLAAVLPAREQLPCPGLREAVPLLFPVRDWLDRAIPETTTTRSRTSPLSMLPSTM